MKVHNRVLGVVVVKANDSLGTLFHVESWPRCESVIAYEVCRSKVWKDSLLERLYVNLIEVNLLAADIGRSIERLIPILRQQSVLDNLRVWGGNRRQWQWMLEDGSVGRTPC